ncbi:bestrophin family ion channel [Sorangium sp. So ce726]|uniref:bestrophin family protein n=1 Tax=Sorangium sp. So ce726 TaxID=3133319 RepID=UPI003F60E3C3
MIPYTRRSWLPMLVSPRGSLSPGVMRRVLAFGVIAASLWLAHRSIPRVSLSIGIHEVAGAVIALILAFRTNTAYNRFWEGRTLWGSIVNASRNITRIVNAHAAVDPGAAREVAVWVVVFVHAARRSLRGQAERPEIDRLLPAEQIEALTEHPHPPLRAAQQISERLAAFVRAGSLERNMAVCAEEQLSVLVNCLGGCERILKTPTPLGYILLLQRGVALYLATLPLALVEALGVLTPVVTMMVAYPVLMIEALGGELDDPFGHEPNDLPLTRICDTIERDLLGSSPLNLVMASKAESYQD